MRREILPAAPEGVLKAANIPATRGSGVWWIVAVGVFAGIVLPLTNYLAGRQDGDCILAAIMSTQKLTWYYWGQGRFLNFIPALAKPIMAIAWNLRFQVFLRAFFQYLSPIGILCLFSRSARVLALATVLTNCILVFAVTQLVTVNLYVAENPYGTSLVLFSLSIFVLRRGQFGIISSVLALIISAVAYATNISLLTISFPLIAVAILGQCLPRREIVSFFAINVLGLMLAMTHAQHFGNGQMPIGSSDISLSAIRSGYAQVLQNISWPAFIVMGVLAAFLGYRRKVSHLYVMLFLMLCWILFVGPLSFSGWVQLNGFSIRYYSMLIVGFVACVGYLLACTYYSYLDNARMDVAIIFALLAVQIFAGLNGISRNYDQLVDPSWREMSGAVADEALKEKADLVVGSYWDVWPAVFDALDKGNKEAARPREIYGVTYRSGVLQRRILRLAEQRGRARAICFLPMAQECVETVQNALNVRADMVPGSLTTVTVNNNPMLLMDLVFER